MQSAETYSQSTVGIHKMSRGFVKVSTKVALLTSHSSLRKEPVKKRRPTLTPILLKKNVPHKLPQKESQHQDALFDERSSQVEHYICLIKDPLWKQVCGEVVNIMGPLALQIFHAQLGAFSSQATTVNLYCQTEEMSHFIQKYDFVILGSLQRYFPTLRELEVIILS